MDKKPILTIILPCFNEEKTLKTAYFELFDVLKFLIEEKKIAKESYITLIDDGSTDKTWEKITKLSRYKNIKGIKLSKSFGHQGSLVAGLTHCEADIYVTLDANFTNDLKSIIAMVEKHLQGYEIVYGIKSHGRATNFIKKAFASFCHSLLGLWGINATIGQTDFRLISKRVTNIVKELKDYNVHLKELISNLGFKSCNIYYSKEASLTKKENEAFLSPLTITLEKITANSMQPLVFVTYFSGACFIFSMFISVFLLYDFFIIKNLPQWCILFVLIFILFGFTLLFLGILGEYIRKIFKETKQKPKFIIETITETL